MWTVIYIAPTQKLASVICSRLQAEGFLTKQRQTAAAKQQIEILVPEVELEDIKELWTDILHSSFS